MNTNPDRDTLRQRIAAAIWERQNPGRRYADCEYRWQADAEADADAVLAVLPEPADQAAALNRAADAVFALDYDVMVGEEGDENLGSMREAWDLGTIHAEKLLRRLVGEAAVVPPPALTEEGRLRAQIQVLQQDAERDQGLAKVGARCMRDGHQGLIEQGRLVLEGWRFALSTALDLGMGAPWEAIHERVKELTAAVSGPCVAGEQQNETPEAEAHPPTHTWKVESPRRDTWASWGATYDDREWASERYESAIEHASARAFRLVCATTTYTVEAEHTPAVEASE